MRCVNVIHNVCVETETETESRKCLWTCFSVCAHYFWVSSSMYTLFCMCMLSCQHAFVFVFMCVLASVLRVCVCVHVCVCACVSVCVRAGSRAPLGDGLIQQGSTSKRLTAARASASLTLT